MLVNLIMGFNNSIDALCLKKEIPLEVVRKLQGQVIYNCENRYQYI